VNREDIRQGAEELEVPLEDHIQFMIDALRPHEGLIGLGGG
jgi:predicted hydrolase (HD superfamily)